MDVSVTQPIGVFDSGVGGVSVLAELIQHLPHETYLYYGDSANAPYGVKEPSIIQARSLEVARFLLDQGSKALVVACNTATSVAIEALRGAFSIPIIGMEPALKPAIQEKDRNEIVVMATPLTLKEKKFALLMGQLKQDRTIVPLPCPGLVEIIERQGATGEQLEAYLRTRFQQAGVPTPRTIVLGCTHYVFIRQTLKKVFGPQVKLIDGNYGTVMQVKRLLEGAGMLKQESSGPVQVLLYNSDKSPRLLIMSEMLLKNRLEELGVHRPLLITGKPGSPISN